MYLAFKALTWNKFTVCIGHKGVMIGICTLAKDDKGYKVGTELIAVRRFLFFMVAYITKKGIKAFNHEGVDDDKTNRVNSNQ